MRDEDSGAPIECPYCGSEGDCKHLLAMIDLSFLECSGGYAYARFREFHGAIEDAFLRELKAGASATVKWGSPELDCLWTDAHDHYSSEDPGWVEIDGDILYRSIVEWLDEAGGDRYPGIIDDEGGPRFSSAIALFYAKSPKQVFDRATALLAERLAQPKPPARRLQRRAVPRRLRSRSAERRKM